MNCLLIDVGSSFVKYGVYNDTTNQMIANGQVPFPEASLADGIHFHVSAVAILDNIKKLFEEAKPYRCRKAYFSVQMHGYLLRDDNGNFSDYVSWRDKSGDTSDPRFQEIDFQQMGTSLKANLPLTKLAFRQTEGEFFTLGSYLVWALSGVNATHITDACPSGFFYADTGLCNAYCGNLKMPKAYTLVQPVGTYQDILLYTPIGDHQISYLGSHAAEDKYLVNIGTATQISCVTTAEGNTAGSYDDHKTVPCASASDTKEQITDSLPGNAPLPGLYEQRPYLAPGQTLHTITGLIGGAQIYQGGQEEAFYQQFLTSLKRLPAKKEILLGGGGAPQIFDYLQERFNDCKLTLIEENIGMEGLKIIATENKIKAGTMLSEITFPNFPIIVKNCGLDFFILDNEHGAFDYSAMAALIMNANLVQLETIVRIGDYSRSHITKLADLGAKGFLLPMTNCADDIAEIVKFAKYSPIGKRGVSTTRAHTLYNPPKLTAYMKSANEQMKVYAQIETKSGVDNVKEILAVNGVDGVYIGPNDLSVDLDCLENRTLLFECIRKVAEAAQEAGKPWGIITTDKELIAFSQELNVNCISYGSELNMLINGCKQIRERF